MMQTVGGTDGGVAVGRSGLDIAVVGTGIAGMSCAWLLSRQHRVTVYESSGRVGGHTNTVLAATASGPLPIDTGFIVFNETTYPNLTALFDHLGVATEASDMSFAVSMDQGRLEYAGTDVVGMFAQRRNLLRPGYWSMMRDLLRFYRTAPGDLARLHDLTVTLDDYLRMGGYGARLRDDHILPMAAAIWSCPAADAARQPAASFIRFFVNHGLLNLSNRPLWRTVRGGANTYIDRLTQPFSRRIRTNHRVVGVERTRSGVRIQTPGVGHVHDHVVLACHADQALALLGAGATREERTRLGAFRSTRNLAVLHTDATFMPRRRRAWASWNYLGGTGADAMPCVTYWMNQLQNLPGETGYFVTLNPPRPPSSGTLLHSEVYEHPVMDGAAIEAQRHLWSLQNRGNIWFCGAWFGAGFHEDGLQAGLAVAEELGGVRRPWTVANESGRIHLGLKQTMDAVA